MVDQLTDAQERAADKAMMSSFAGLTDAEAFAQLFNDAVEILMVIHRQRGETTDEDLLEKTQFRLENALGYKPPPEDYDAEEFTSNVNPALKIAVEKFLNE